MSIPRINPRLMSAETRANLERVQARHRITQESMAATDVIVSDKQNGGERAKGIKDERQRWKSLDSFDDVNCKIPRGAKFGMLTVIDVGRTVAKKKMSLCKCECGSFTVVQNGHLISGHTTSCGCKNIGIDLQKKEILKAKFSHPLYKAWNSMKQRCYNPDAIQYHNYGARGITVCDEWRKSYSSFQKWALLNGWKSGLSLDRIDNNGNYCPDNCRWTDNPTQGRNRRTNVLLTYKGETKTIADWSEQTGLYYTTLIERYRQGWSPEEIIETPKRAYNRGGEKGKRAFAKFSLFINPLLLSTGQQKKMNFVTKTIFVDSRVENGMHLVELAAKPHTAEVLRVCPLGTRIALTVTFLCPYPSGTPEQERIERGLMGEGFDCDNKYKAIGDAFTNAGWWSDDRYVTCLKIEKRRTIAMPRIEIIVEPDKIREPELLSDESAFEDVAIPTGELQEEDLSLFEAMNVSIEPDTEEHKKPTLFADSEITADPSETNPLSDLMNGGLPLKP